MPSCHAGVVVDRQIDAARADLLDVSPERYDLGYLQDR
jgi:hypothetical protein